MSGLLIFIVLAVALIGIHKSGVTASEGDSVLGGVCAGIARQTDMSPGLVRVLTVLAAFFTGGFVILLYLCLWISLPRR